VELAAWAMPGTNGMTIHTASADVPAISDLAGSLERNSTLTTSSMERRNVADKQRVAHRIEWLDLLRAIAVLLVVFGHIFIAGPNDPQSVGSWLPGMRDFIFGPNTFAENRYGLWGAIVAVNTGMVIGGTGVCIFFLVSGFVILQSIDRMQPGEFLLRRAIRLFPVSLVVTVVVAMVTASYAVMVEEPQRNSVLSTIASGLALQGYFQVFPAIPVVWSLSAELIFYVLLAAAVALAGRLERSRIVMVALGCLALTSVARMPFFVALLPSSVHSRLSYTSELMVYVNYMLLGAVLYRWQSTGRALASAVAFALVLVTFILSHMVFMEPPGRYLGIGLPDAIWSLVFFVAVMLMRPRGRWCAPLLWVAKVSYPLYLVHLPLGWVGLAVFHRLGFGIDAACILSAILVFGPAWLLHISVEQPSHRFAKWITGRKVNASTKLK